MSNKGKKDQQHSSAHQAGTSHDPVYGDARVHGAVEVHPSPSLVEQHAADRKEDNTQKNKEYTISIATLIAVIVYSGLTLILVIIGGWNVKIAHDTYVAANRPYIGVNTIQFVYFGDDAVPRDRPNKDTNQLAFKAEIKNFGAVPGGDFAPTWKVFIGGVRAYNEGIPATPSILFPGQVAYLSANTGNEYTAIVTGKKELVVEVTIQYSGPSASYQYCEKHQYSPVLNGFMGLGKCTH
jgi:hypothetical protein